MDAVINMNWFPGLDICGCPIVRYNTNMGLEKASRTICLSLNNEVWGIQTHTVLYRTVYNGDKSYSLIHNTVRVMIYFKKSFTHSVNLHLGWIKTFIEKKSTLLKFKSKCEALMFSSNLNISLLHLYNPLSFIISNSERGCVCHVHSYSLHLLSRFHFWSMTFSQSFHIYLCLMNTFIH